MFKVEDYPDSGSKLAWKFTFPVYVFKRRGGVECIVGASNQPSPSIGSGLGLFLFYNICANRRSLPCRSLVYDHFTHPALVFRGNKTRHLVCVSPVRFSALLGVCGFEELNYYLYIS